MCVIVNSSKGIDHQKGILMNTENLLNFIEDDDVRLIAKNAKLGEWEWGTDNPLAKLAMIEGAAIMLKEFLDDTPLLMTGEDGSKVMLWHVLGVKFGKDVKDIDAAVLTAGGEVSWSEWAEATGEPEPIYKSTN